MPDGVSVSHYVATTQARPKHGLRRGSSYRITRGESREGYARGYPTSARKNPARVRAPAGSCSVSSQVVFAGVRLGPFSNKAPTNDGIGGPRDGYPDRTGRFKHRQRREHR
jgi:hypothetical protein